MQTTYNKSIYLAYNLNGTYKDHYITSGYFTYTFENVGGPWTNWLLHDSNVTNKTQAFIDSGIVLPTSQETDISDKMSLSYSVNGKTIYYWNTTPAADLPDDAACRYRVIRDTETNTDMISDILGNCKDVQRVEVPEYSNYMLSLDIVSDLNNDGVILPEFEVIGNVHKTLIIDGSNYSGTIGENWSTNSSDKGFLLISQKLSIH